MPKPPRYTPVNLLVSNMSLAKSMDKKAYVYEVGLNAGTRQYAISSAKPPRYTPVTLLVSNMSFVKSMDK